MADCLDGVGSKGLCLAAEHPVMGMALKLLVVMTAGTPFDKRSLARHLASRLEPYKVPILYEQVASVARTYNGKLDRKHYTSSDADMPTHKTPPES